MKFDLRDFEKFELGGLLAATVFTTIGVYLYKGEVDSNMVYLTTVLVSAFVARKGLKYHYENGKVITDTTSTDDTTDTTNTANSASIENIKK